MKEYFVLYRVKRHAPIEFMKVKDNTHREHTERLLRIKGYRILMCKTKETVLGYQNKDRKYFLKCCKHYDHKLWDKLLEIDVNKNYQIIDVNCIEKLK